jgi:hypothetical protein
MSPIRIHQDEPPDRVHGRLLEAVHLTGYTGSRVVGELKWLLRQDRWKQVSPGYDDIDAFMATLNLSEHRIDIDDRKDLVQQLAALKAGQRATSRLLGVGLGTVQRDLSTDRMGHRKQPKRPRSNLTPKPSALLTRMGHYRRTTAQKPVSRYITATAARFCHRCRVG